MHRRLVATCALVCLLGLSPVAASAKSPPASWDGMALVKSKRFDAVYLAPDADFRPYTKVMLDPTEVAFRKNWQRDYNSSSMSLGGRIDDGEAEKILQVARTGFEEIFRQSYEEAGYQVVSAPGPDVLRVRTAVANLFVSAPDQKTAGRSRTFSRDAGSAAVILEVRDSQSGALLGRAVDGRVAGDAGPYIRNSVTNQADFKKLFRDWAKFSIAGLNELKSRAPAGPVASIQD
jgi:hypothetical protein